MMCTRKYILFIFLAAAPMFLAGYFLGAGSGAALEISSREDLEAASLALYEEMLRTGVTLTNREIDLLVATDKLADVYVMYPNESYFSWDGNESSVVSSIGYGKGSSYVHYHTAYDNGTRIYERYSPEGELLKYFLINDEPEKRITIIIKE